MEVTASKRLGSMMFVVTLILWSSIGVDAAISTECKLKCTAFCVFDPDQTLCILNCLKSCPRQSPAYVALEYCDMGCFLSTCLDYHPDTKKVEANAEKVGACADSCSQGCKKTSLLN
ncbi:hypothetical protein ACJRO7_010116 [Eucalyptus globulus]|uniref:Thionin-like protein n=1 Tax=Eucalyptus globulus TaxID=34317 RepID=A0ABD3LEH0_EUCGL